MPTLKSRFRAAGLSIVALASGMGASTASQALALPPAPDFSTQPNAFLKWAVDQALILVTTKTQGDFLAFLKMPNIDTLIGQCVIADLPAVQKVREAATTLDPALCLQLEQLLGALRCDEEGGFGGD